MSDHQYSMLIAGVFFIGALLVNNEVGFWACVAGMSVNGLLALYYVIRGR